MDQNPITISKNNAKAINEGSANIITNGNVFYNPVQEFNRDLSISVIRAFSNIYLEEKQNKCELKKYPRDTRKSKTLGLDSEGGVEKHGLLILEALSATGLRSIRYAKEISKVSKILANDISSKAVQDIKQNIINNQVEDIVEASQNDATMLMYQHRSKEEQFDVIDLDPYGCPSIFLDSAVQAVKNGGLLLVTATDMAVLAGNAPETCYSKYGAISLRTKSCHEMAIRILLQCIESHANRYSRFIVPLLSISVDFYIRVFVRIYSGAQKCKFSTSKLSHVYHCTGCDSFTLEPLGLLKKNDKHKHEVKFAIPTGPPVEKHCEHCRHTHHIGGPVWSAPIHSVEFVHKALAEASENLGTFKRLHGVLSVISEELVNAPLYYTLEKLCGTIHVETPSMMTIRSAILNAGYEVSFTHMNKTSIKTNAPGKVIWDIMRCYERLHPASKKRLFENCPAKNILSISPEKEYSFIYNDNANPESRKSGYVRFQENPLPNWGPGTRATAMVGDEKTMKSKRNQGKRKRENEDNNDKRN